MSIPPDAADDDALAEALADAWVNLAKNDPRLCRIALRAVGKAKAPADMTQDELAREHGTDRHGLIRTAKRALKKLRLAPEVRAFKSIP